MTSHDDQLSPELRHALLAEDHQIVDLVTRHGIDRTPITVTDIVNLPVPAPEDYREFFRLEFDLDIDLLADVLRLMTVSDVRQIIQEADKDHTSRDNYLIQVIDDILRDQDDPLQEEDFGVEDVIDLDEQEEKVLLRDNRGREVTLDAGEDILDVEVYSFLRHQTIIMSRFGVIPDAHDMPAYRAPVSLSPFVTMMSQVNKESRMALVTIATVDGDGDNQVLSSVVRVEDDEIVWDRVDTASAFMDTRVLGRHAVIHIRCIDPSTMVEVLDGDGDSVMVPRSHVGAWRLNLNDSDLWMGMTDTELGDVHSTDHVTGQLLVPEEGVDFVTVHDVARKISN